MQARSDMRYIGKLLGYILLAFNVVVAILMVVSAYSPHVNPLAHPVWSCAGLFFPIFLFGNFFFFLFWLLVYWKYAWLPLIALLVCWNAVRTYFPINGWGEETPEDAIKILSYNTQAFGEKSPHTKRNPNDVLSYLQNCDADIICLQEYIWGGKLKKADIDNALRDYKYKHFQSIGKGLNGLGVYSRYPILSATPLKYKTNRNGSVAYRIKVGNDTLLVVNNHLESFKIHESDVEIVQGMVAELGSEKQLADGWKLLNKLALATAIRSRQADVLLKTVADAKEKYVVVCGDFNDSPISYTHHVLHEKLDDAFVEAGNGFGISYHEHQLFFRIDHILLSRNMKVYDCVVDNTTEASDHYPIWCYISLDNHN